MDLPKEILQLIAESLDDRAILNVRLINTLWFKSIKKIHFSIYLPRSDNLPAIIDRLSKYDSLISLTIRKPFRMPLREFIQQIARLSNLTSLTFPYFSDFELDAADPTNQPNWQLLTNLTNLREITIINPKRLRDTDKESSPEEFLRALVHLPHLATLQLTNCNYTSQELDTYIPLLTRLEDVSAPMMPNLDLLPSLSTHLTRLCFTVPAKKPILGNKDINIYQNLRVLQLLSTDIQHISLSGISSLVTLEVSAKRVTGIDNNTKLRHLQIIANDSECYDQIRKLPHLEWMHIDMQKENTDPFFFSEFNKLTYLYILMYNNYEVWNVSSSVKSLELELELSNFNYASLSVLTSLENLSIDTFYWHAQKQNYLAEVSSLTGLTSLRAGIYPYLRLANLSTLTNLERLEAVGCLSLEKSFLSYLTKLRALANYKLKEEHFAEIATLTRLTHLAYSNAEELRGNFSVLSHLPLKIFSAQVWKDDLNSFVKVVSTMTSLDVLAMCDVLGWRSLCPQGDPTDWSLLSNLTHLTRLDLDMEEVTSDTLTLLTRVTSLQYLFVKKPATRYDSEDEEEGNGDEHNVSDQKPALAQSIDNEWAAFTTKFANLVSVAYIESDVYSDPANLSF